MGLFMPTTFLCIRSLARRRASAPVLFLLTMKRYLGIYSHSHSHRERDLGAMASVITISRQLGSGGNAIASQVAERLHYDLVDHRLIQEVARAANVPESVVERYDERPENPFLDFLRSMVVIRAPHTVFPVSETEPSEDLLPVGDPVAQVADSRGYLPWRRGDFLRLVQMSIASLADAGRVVIVGRAAPVILKDRRDALHVKTIAPMGFRVRRLIDELGLGEQEAVEMLRKSDKARAGYLKVHYGTDWNDSLAYHLTINTASMGIGRAVGLIVHAAQMP